MGNRETGRVKKEGGWEGGEGDHQHQPPPLLTILWWGAAWEDRGAASFVITKLPTWEWTFRVLKEAALFFDEGHASEMEEGLKQSFQLLGRWRPYRVESTRSLPTSEVKQPRAWLVLWWGTAWEDQGAASFFFVTTKPPYATWTSGVLKEASLVFDGGKSQ